MSNNKDMRSIVRLLDGVEMYTLPLLKGEIQGTPLALIRAPAQGPLSPQNSSEEQIFEKAQEIYRSAFKAGYDLGCEKKGGKRKTRRSRK